MINLNFVTVDNQTVEAFATHLESIGHTDLLKQWRQLLTSVEGRYTDTGIMLDKIRSMAESDLIRHMEAHFISYITI